MKFYLSESEYALLKEISLLDGTCIRVLHPCPHMVYIEPTGTQVRELVKRLFDCLWQDLMSVDDKRLLSFLGWRLTDKCL